METNNFDLLRAIRSKKLFQIEFIDVIGSTPDTREQFIGFVLKDPKAQGGVRFSITTFDVNYRFTTETDSDGNVTPLPLYSLVEVHFIVPVNPLDDHLKTFLHKIRKGSKVTYTVTINQSDDYLNNLGFEKHLLTARIGSESYLIASWVGKPDKTCPVKYPRTSSSTDQLIGDSMSIAEGTLCNLEEVFSGYSLN